MQNFLWSEDGTIFINRSINTLFGKENGIFQTYSGYFHLIPQLLTFILTYLCFSVFGNIYYLPLLLSTFCLLFESFCFYYFLSDRFDYCANKKQRAVVVVFLILSPLTFFFEVWGNITNFQWWAGIIIYLESLNIIYSDDKIPQKSQIFLSLIVLSTPLCVIFLISFFVKSLKKILIERTPLLPHFKQNIILLSAIIVQILIILLQNRLGNQQLNNILTSMSLTAKAMYYHFFSYYVTAGYPNELFLVHIISITSIIMMLFVFIKNKLSLFLVYSFVIIFFVLFISYKGQTYNGIFEDRYAFIPCYIYCFIQSLSLVKIWTIISEKKKNIVKIVSITILIIYTFSIERFYLLHNFYVMNTTEYIKKSEELKRCIINGTEKIIIPIAPGPEYGWRVECFSN